ncbi:unnamed protein product [Prunus armeniaca]|uniref:Uncharacterized protein n=1 Tax=Prunus armeniaca TaxID=36596 RepID=A0A6J5U118_PRUAR|nr:unnamed protein product [Prunus armeniaca]
MAVPGFSSVYFSAWSNRSSMRPLCRALGNGMWPALASLLQTYFKIYKLTFNEDTLPEPSRVTTENIVPRESNSGKIVNISVENGPTQPLLSNSKAKQKMEMETLIVMMAEEDPVEIQKPVNSIVSAYRY